VAYTLSQGTQKTSLQTVASHLSFQGKHHVVFVFKKFRKLLFSDASLEAVIKKAHFNNGLSDNLGKNKKRLPKNNGNFNA